jgi:7-keto-8-aminopelargonate synthetase-like enzyme
VKLAGGSEAVNFVSFDFLGLAGDKGVQACSGTQNPWLSSAAC